MENRSDINLQQLVIDELDWEPAVNAAEIGVSVRDGIVMLTGTVSSYAEKRAAEEAVLRLRDVKAVAEDIEVRLEGASERNDGDIAEMVLNVIKWNVYLPDEALKVKVENGVVTLSGAVERPFQRDKAVDAVRPLIGVRSVVDLMKVRPRATSRDIRERIREALERNAAEHPEDIHISVRDGEVTLSGSVRTLREREDAVRSAWAAPGVTKVIDEIKLKRLAYA